MTAPAPATSARPSSTNTRVLGGLLLVFGSGWMLKQSGVVDIPWTGVVSFVLIALGLAMVVTARTRARSMPLIVLGAVLTVGLAVGSSNIGLTGGIGDRMHRPTALQSSERYTLGIGEMTVDLTRAQLDVETTTVRAKVSIGQLLVKVPAGIPFRVESETRFGNVKVLGEDRDVHGRDTDTFESSGYEDAPRKFLLILSVGVGQIKVEN